MAASRKWLLGWLGLLVGVSVACGLWPTQGDVFVGSFDFPRVPPKADEPWKSIDFEDQPERYLETVYRYVLASNVDARGEWKTDVEHWFHVPDFEGGVYGREGRKGLTRERSSRPRELDDAQLHCAQNWAVGVYNELGGYTLGQVWNEACPSESAALRPDVQFLEGTVAAKLLFTSATVQDVPYLEGAYEWKAEVHRDSHVHGDAAADAFQCRADTDAKDPHCRREEGVLRLIQFDLAVKDERSKETGWVFGTFVYDGSAPGASVWDRMRPLGLSWGDHVDKQRILPASRFKRLGCQKALLNGPVDSTKGSCLSCHGRATEPYAYDLGPAPLCAEPTQTAGVAATPEPLRSFDFSLQVAMGRARHCNVEAPASPPNSECKCEAPHDEPVADASGR